MNLTLIAVVAAGGLFLGMLVFLEFGQRAGRARIKNRHEGLAKGVGAAEGAVFGLLGLVIAFTFSGAASRFEERRHLITQEANAIGTAYLRLDLLPQEAQPEIRDLARRYVEVRAVIYANVADEAVTKAGLDETLVLQEEIWRKALAATRKPGGHPQAALLLVPALNEMFDITTTRIMAGRNHPPLVVFLMLAGLTFIGSMLVGYSMAGNKGRSWLHTVAFAAVMSLVAYVIIDLEFPRLGLIRVDAADQILIDLRQGMH